MNVKLPDGTVAAFPDSMSQDQILGVLRQKFPPTSQGSKDQGGFAALWEGLKQGAIETGQGVAQLGSRIGLPAMLPGAGAKLQQAGQGLDQAIQQRQQAYGQNPSVQAHPIAAGLGRFGGGMAATAPLMALPVGQASLAGRVGMGALGGALGGATAPVQGPAQGGDFWKEKAKQAAIGAGVGSVLPGLRGGATAAPAARAEGMSLTPGMAMGGPMRAAEHTFRTYPIVGRLISGAEGRTMSSFQRAVGNQALEPIGQSLPRGLTGGEEIAFKTREMISDAYDRLKPHLSFRDTPQFTQDLQAMIPQLGKIPSDEVNRFAATLNLDLFDRMGGGTKMERGPTGPMQLISGSTQPMDGDAFKQFEIALNKARSSAYRRQEYELADLYDDTLQLTRKHLIQQNGPYGNELQNINHAWSLYRYMADAGLRRAKAFGNFTPEDLAQASHSRDPSQHNQPSRALMRALAEVGSQVLDAPTGKAAPRKLDENPITQVMRLTVGGAAAPVYGVALGMQRGAQAVPQAISKRVPAAQQLSPALGAEAARDTSRRPTKSYLRPLAATTP